MTPVVEEMQDCGDSREVKRAETVDYKSSGIDVGQWRSVAWMERQLRPPDHNAKAWPTRTRRPRSLVVVRRRNIRVGRSGGTGREIDSGGDAGRWRQIQQRHGRDVRWWCTWIYLTDHIILPIFFWFWKITSFLLPSPFFEFTRMRFYSLLSTIFLYLGHRVLYTLPSILQSLVLCRLMLEHVLDKTYIITWF